MTIGDITPELKATWQWYERNGSALAIALAAQLAKRRELEHELEAVHDSEMGTHGVDGLCDLCRMTPERWLEHVIETELK